MRLKAMDCEPERQGVGIRSRQLKLDYQVLARSGCKRFRHEFEVFAT